MYNRSALRNLLVLSNFLANNRFIMKKFQCAMCGWIYDEEKGAPDEGIEPGTAWSDVPEDWECPVCGSGKDDFEMVEI